MVTRFILALMTGMVLMFSGEAHAACINGKVEFWWELGNYCDSNDRTCTDWRYTDSPQDTWWPMKEVIFEVRKVNSSTVLATGDVDDQGNFAACYSGTESQVDVKFWPEQQERSF